MTAGTTLAGVLTVLPTPFDADGGIRTEACVADHCGYAEDDKPPDSIARSGNGLPGVEQLLPLMLDAVIRKRWLSENELECVLCSGPARAFGLVGKGRLAAGFDADVVLIDPTARHVVEHRHLHDRTFYSPYEGWELYGRVERELRRGETIVDCGVLQSDSPGAWVQVSSAEQVRGAHGPVRTRHQ